MAVEPFVDSAEVSGGVVRCRLGLSVLQLGRGGDEGAGAVSDCRWRNGPAGLRRCSQVPSFTVMRENGEET